MKEFSEVTSHCLFSFHSKCGLGVQSGHSFCPDCKRTVQQCKQCQHYNRPIAQFCRICGNDLGRLSPWGMVGGLPERTAADNNSSQESSSALWDMEKGKALYNDGEIAHFYPQCIWTDELIVFLGHDRFDHKEPHLIFVDASTGQYLYSHPHHWLNTLSHSPVSNGTELWCLSLNQLFRYSLLQNMQTPEVTSFPKNTVPVKHAAPLWFSPPDSAVSEGLLCYLTNHCIWCLDRNLQEVALILLPWSETDPSTFRTLAGSWPWLLATTEHGEALLIQFKDTGGSYQIVWQGKLPVPDHYSSYTVSAPLFADGSFWLEVLASSSVETNRKPQRVTHGLICVSIQDTAADSNFPGNSELLAPEFIDLQEALLVDTRDVIVSTRYPMLYDPRRKHLFTYSGIDPDSLTLNFFGTETRNTSRLLIQGIQSIPRYRSCLLERQLLLAEPAGYKLISISLMTGQKTEHPLLDQLSSVRFDGTPVSRSNQLFLSVEDRYIHISKSSL